MNYGPPGLCRIFVENERKYGSQGVSLTWKIRQQSNLGKLCLFLFAIIRALIFNRNVCLTELQKKNRVTSMSLSHLLKSQCISEFLVPKYFGVKTSTLAKPFNRLTVLYRKSGVT